MFKKNKVYFLNIQTENINAIKNQINQFFKKGGTIKNKINIKKSNRGKFTKSAKDNGESVQSYAHDVMNNPKATKLQKERANFAIQAKKWNHK